MSRMERAIAIGALATAAGVKVPTIRYYESVGLLPETARSASNRRVYGNDAVRRLRFIRHARELGFDVDDIRQLLALADQPHRTCADVDAIAQRHLSDIESRIRRLRKMKAEMSRMITACAKGSVAECRIIDALARHEQ